MRQSISTAGKIYIPYALKLLNQRNYKAFRSELHTDIFQESGIYIYIQYLSLMTHFVITAVKSHQLSNKHLFLECEPLCNLWKHLVMRINSKLELQYRFYIKETIHIWILVSTVKDTPCYQVTRETDYCNSPVSGPGMELKKIVSCTTKQLQIELCLANTNETMKQFKPGWEPFGDSQFRLEL